MNSIYQLIKDQYNWFILAYLILSITMSLIFGFKSIEIHDELRFDENKKLLGVDNMKKDLKSKRKALLYHQYWFNFVGSFTGWIALFPILKNIFIFLCPKQTLIEISWSQFGLFLIAILGITGYLPLTIHNLAKSLNKLFPPKV